MRLDDVTVRYGRVEALREASIELTPGQVTGLVGVNGAGKSSMLLAMSGAKAPVAGRILVSGADLYGRRSRRHALRRVALMPQEGRFPETLTAIEVVEYLAWTRGMSTHDSRLAARRALGDVGLGPHVRRRMSQLSGGMRRRVALAQAIAGRPHVLLLDEPSTGLDPQQRHDMVELIRGLDSTVFLSSHIMEDVTDIAADVVVLDRGRVAFAGPMNRLLDHTPSGTRPGREAEAAFLHVVAERGPAR